MIRKSIKTLFIGLTCIISFSLQAQDYNWSAPLDSVTQDGFYKLILKPDVTSRILTDNYSDLRIYDQDKKVVPYLLQEEWNDDKKWFEEYAILSKEINPERFTKLVIHNPKKNSINNFSLVVKNNNAYKIAKLSGSDDNQNWFFITDHYSLSMMQDQQGVVSEKRINFPLTNYEYYKLEVNDSASAPLNILKVGYYKTAVETNQQTLLPEPSLHQADSLTSKQTFIEFHFNSKFHINALTFGMEGPKFYKRKAVLYKMERTVKGQVQLTEQFAFDLLSDDQHVIPTPDLYDKDFLLVIDNGDNESLKVTSIKAFQTTHYLVAYLKRDKQYSLSVGYKKAESPLYDLANFRDSIPTILPEVKPLRFEFLGKEKTKVEVKEEWFKSRMWIWSALAVVIGLLGLISYRMIKEMDKKENQ